MRTILVILIYFIPLIGSSQLPVDVVVHAEKMDPYQYKVHFLFSIEKGWHVYAQKDSALALDSLSISTIDSDAYTLIDQGGFVNYLTRIHDPVFNNKILTVFQRDFTINKILFINGTIPPVIAFSIKGFASNNKEFLPIDLTKQLEISPGTAVADFKIPSLDINAPVSDCGDSNSASSKGLLAIFLLGFGGGLLALLTPCVFPMVPVTLSYFTGKSKSKEAAMRRGILYGLCILFIYLVASIPFHLIGNLNPQTLNLISTNSWLNIFFFVVFILFALSFFGLFEITLPSSLSNVAGSKSGLGSVAGIFFMALTLVVVSFSCTGPILGSLLVGSVSSQNGAWSLTSGMAGFGCALGLPFALFAIFPHWIQRLPKGGPWMNVVKKSLAFIELALAIKFLSNADLVQHWGILKREVFIGMWIVIFFCLALYLFGVFEKRKQFYPSPVLRIVGDEKKHGISKGRYLFGVLTLLFSFYLTPGLTQTQYANLKLLSGFAPPLSYSIYGNENVRGKGLEADVVNDYKKAVALSKLQNKPLLIDFTGWACVNCRKMEENVWPDGEIQNLIKEKFILVSLYVDDRKRLPPDQQQKDVITIGDKYAKLQAANFKQVTQPLYAIVSPQERLMNHPVGYTPSVKEYRQWLECGYNAFKISSR